MADADGRRPDFLLIGAPKCGTTWLTRRLALHPGIAMPADEVHFFSREYGRGWGWYLDHFAGAGVDQRLGENSNSYLTEEGALDRIAAELPDARFLCVLRDPVERAYSSYGMQVDRGRATGDIDLYLDPERSPRPHILSNGLYAEQLAPWIERFGPERVFVGLFDDIRADPSGLYRRALEFIGVDPAFVPGNLTERENARKASGVPGPVKRALWWLRPYLDRGPLRALRDGPIGRAATRRLSRPKRYPPLAPELKERLRDYYAADSARLETMIGVSLDRWRDARA